MSNKLDENTNKNLKKTPLFFAHEKLNAKMVPFAGWLMPVQYSAGLVAEHHAVRKFVGVFDVSHMGEFEIMGPQSTQFLQECTVNDVSIMDVGQAQYNAICNEHGCILDDIIIYKKSDDNYFICVNASNIEKDFKWFADHLKNFDVHFKNISDGIGQIAIQGPKSRDVLLKFLPSQIQTLKYYHFFETILFDEKCLVSRTGYTGELGYEIYCPAHITEKLWEKILKEGEEYSILPCGLGARDTLRLEVGYLLYGNDMDENSTVLECGLKWITKFEKENFIGKQALIEQNEKGPEKKLVGFEMSDRAVGRHGYKVFDSNDSSKEIGVITSGSPSPTLSKNIGFMYVKNENSKLGTNVLVEIRGQLRSAQIVKKIFYTQGSVHD